MGLIFSWIVPQTIEETEFAVENWMTVILSAFFFSSVHFYRILL